MDKLQWIIELMDRASGPARKVARALDSVRVAKDKIAKTPESKVFDSLERASSARRLASRNRMGRELDAFSRSQRSATGESSMFAGALGAVGGVLLTVGAAALAAAGAIAGVGASAARSVVELAGFQESTMVAMQTMLGSRGAANAEFASSLRIARMTPFDTRAVVSMRRQLLGAGFRDSHERDALTGLVADIAAMNPEDSTLMTRLGLAVAQIRGAGRLRGQELNQLNQAGLAREPLFAEIGRIMNFRGSATQINRQVSAAMEAGRVTDRITFAAAIRSTMRQTGTTRIGEFSGRQSTTIPGLLSTLNSSVSELLLGDDASGRKLFESAGFTAFKGFVQQLIDMLSSTSATGQRLQRIMRGVIDEVFGLLESDKTKKGGLNLTSLFTRMLDSIESTINAVRVLVKWGAALGGGYWSVMGPTLQAIADAASWVMRQLGGSEAQSTLDTLRAIGQVIGVLVVIAGAPFMLLVTVVSALAYAFWKVGEFLAFAVDKLDEFVGTVIPDWLLSLMGAEGAPSLEMQGATNIVNNGRAEGVGRPIVSQPNVTVNVNALTNGQMTPEEIAASAGAVIPGVVQTSAERATGGAR